MAAAVSNPHPSVGEVPPLESGSLIGDPECRAVDDLRLLEDLDGMLELVAGDRDQPWRIELAASSTRTYRRPAAADRKSACRECRSAGVRTADTR